MATNEYFFLFSFFCGIPWYYGDNDLGSQKRDHFVFTIDFLFYVVKVPLITIRMRLES